MSSQLTHYDAARSALQKAHSVDEVKRIRGKAEALRVYARQANDTEMQTLAVRIKLRATRRLGEIEKEQRDKGEIAKKGQGRRKRNSDGIATVSKATLKELGIDRRLSATATKLAAIPESKFEAIVIETMAKEGELTNAAVLREVVQGPVRAAKEALAEKIKREPAPPPSGPFRVMAIDPPWKYGSRADDPTHRSRNPDPRLTLDQIKALPVGEKAHPDGCILWLWTTNAFIWEVRACLDAWGFECKTILTWVKDRMGTGDWLRGRTEHCLMAIRGKPIVTLTNQTTVISGPLREHSRKPDEFYALVESLCPGNKGEWFARQER